MSIIVVPAAEVAADLSSRIHSGASFEAMALTYSIDGTAARGGSMGSVNESSLRPEFQAALKGLRPGAVSPVIRAGDSFVLLKRTTDDEDRWRSQHDLAVATIQQGGYTEAASMFLAAVEQAEKFGPDDVRLADSLNGLAQVYRFQQKYLDAAPRAQRALAILERAIGPSNEALIPSLLSLASIARATDRHADAEQFYRRILNLRWGTPGTSGIGAGQVLENFAEILTLVQTRDSRLEKALDQFWASVSDSRLNKDIFVGMRDRLLAVQLVPEAESLMERAVRLEPDSRQLRYRLGELYAIWGKYEKAIEAFEDALRFGASTDPAADRTQRARIYERIGEMNFFLVRFDAAFAALNKALEINLANTGSRLLLGALYLRRNRFDEAAAEYRRVIAAEPRNAVAYDGLANVNLSLGHYREAAADATKAVEIDPGQQTSRYTRAMALIRDEREEGKAALEDYQKHEDEIESTKARRDAVAQLERTSSALLAEKQPEKALDALREGLRTHRLSAVLHWKLGLIQSQLNLHKEAAETFETMVRLKLDDFLVHRQLAREYELLGDMAAAQQQRVLYLQLYHAALQTNLN